MYSQGSSEEILGRALKDFANRDDIVIATKVRHPMRPGPNGALIGAERQHLPLLFAGQEVVVILHRDESCPAVATL
jgi:aryl-alcohol dehydrogenase-like predicted oxidoreductase